MQCIVSVNYHDTLNSLEPVEYECDIKLVIRKLVWRINILCISCEIVIRWMPKDFPEN